MEDLAPRPEEEPRPSNWVMNLWWLLPGLLPAVFALCLYKRDGDVMPEKWFWILNGVCSLVAGFGLWRSMRWKTIVRGIAGVMTGGLLLAINYMVFVAVVVGLMLVNFAVAIYQGCCSNGH